MLPRRYLLGLLLGVRGESRTLGRLRVVGDRVKSFLASQKGIVSALGVCVFALAMNTLDRSTLRDNKHIYIYTYIYICITKAVMCSHPHKNINVFHVKQRQYEFN